MGRIKNFIGDILGYADCPVTKRTYWREKVVYITYHISDDGLQKTGLILSPKVKKLPLKEVKKKVKKFLKEERDIKVNLKDLHPSWI